MDNFDLKKFLVENKLTAASKAEELEEGWKDVALGAATLASVGASAKDMDKAADKDDTNISVSAEENKFTKLSAEDAFDYFIDAAKETGFAKAAKVVASTNIASDSAEGQLKRNLISILNLLDAMEGDEEFSPNQKAVIGNLLKKNAQYANSLIAAMKGNVVGIR